MVSRVSFMKQEKLIGNQNLLNDSVEAVQDIDPTLGLVQTCELNTNEIW